MSSYDDGCCPGTQHRGSDPHQGRLHDRNLQRALPLVIHAEIWRIRSSTPCKVSFPSLRRTELPWKRAVSLGTNGLVEFTFTECFSQGSSFLSKATDNEKPLCTRTRTEMKQETPLGTQIRRATPFFFHASTPIEERLIM